MYTRSPQGRFPRDMRVPKNYAGNAFRPPFSVQEKQEPIFIDDTANEYDGIQEQQKSPQETENVLTEDLTHDKEDEKKAEKSDSKKTGLFSFPKFNIGLGKFFSHGGINIGFEELLILGLILLIASEGKGDDLILLLILLLFIQ